VVTVSTHNVLRLARSWFENLKAALLFSTMIAVRFPPTMSKSPPNVPKRKVVDPTKTIQLQRLHGVLRAHARTPRKSEANAIHG